MAMIHLDGRQAGVNVPEHLKNEPHLRLNLSYRFDPPDLAINGWGIRSTLSFSGRRFTVSIPWTALFAITSHVTKEFWIYPEDLPPELIPQPSAGARAASAAAESRGRSCLRSVQMGSEERQAPKPRACHLKLIK